MRVSDRVPSCARHWYAAYQLCQGLGRLDDLRCRALGHHAPLDAWLKNQENLDIDLKHYRDALAAVQHEHNITDRIDVDTPAAERREATLRSGVDPFALDLAIQAHRAHEVEVDTALRRLFDEATLRSLEGPSR